MQTPATATRTTIIAMVVVGRIWHYKRTRSNTQISSSSSSGCTARTSIIIIQKRATKHLPIPLSSPKTTASLLLLEIRSNLKVAPPKPTTILPRTRQTPVISTIRGSTGCLTSCANSAMPVIRPLRFFDDGITVGCADRSFARRVPPFLSPRSTRNKKKERPPRSGPVKCVTNK